MRSPMNEDSDWIEHKRSIISELQRSNDRLGSIEKELREIMMELAVFRTKIYFGSAIVAVLFSAGVAFLTRM